MTDTKTNDTDIESEDTEKPTRRDFVVLAASAVAGVGAITAAVPFIRSLSPDASVLAVGSTEVDLSNIKEGETITVMWRGKPIFVTKRTPNQIEEVRSVNLAELRDPQSDEERVKKGKEQWLVTIGVCTHLGCVPVSGKGDYNGWFCPCHGSHYDSSGRIRKGPAPANLPIPPYEFLSNNKIKIG
ncbi:MAG: ubiquinol-cytochrome c reductase iron-sulfur subunit [Candidatus Midichloria sp.]|uniref:Cytochrome b-c1 complex subunit Rieske, mitochondrial n=1 Tax=Hyalomma marginatum TaxID=34627 RepID=A0A8S4C2P2_9ACAR|nr:Ubiquinol-cytochrome c reductase iron-sulfur subunit [Hyalomma marginatum]CAG7594796.1 Ubiquinol-cytochrome c reductase iron-sulfur subunit [Hyalomma marginatum]